MSDRERQIKALMNVQIDYEAPLHFPVRPHWIPISGSLSREAAEKVLDALAALPSEPDEEAFNEEPILRDPEHRLSRGSWRRRSPSKSGVERQIEGAKQAALRVAQQHWTLADMEDLEAIFEAYEQELVARKSTACEPCEPCESQVTVDYGNGPETVPTWEHNRRVMSAPPEITDEQVERACEAFSPGFLSAMEANAENWPHACRGRREAMRAALEAAGKGGQANG